MWRVNAALLIIMVILMIWCYGLDSYVGGTYQGTYDARSLTTFDACESAFMFAFASGVALAFGFHLPTRRIEAQRQLGEAAAVAD